MTRPMSQTIAAAMLTLLVGGCVSSTTGKISDTSNPMLEAHMQTLQAQQDLSELQSQFPH